ncbi:DUF2304 domain-containing protein [Nanoarchaeota archaeon]
MIEPIQIILALFILFALSRAVLRFKDKKIRTGEFAFWAFVWIVALIVVFIPGSATYFANMLGIGRAVDLVIYLSIALLFYLIFRIYVQIDGVRTDLTKVVQEVAIKKAKKK